ncbi:ATP-binding cassette domain-containing protein [Nitrospirillum pindoramense]|uniref:ATP-binding cassette subfamily C protein n=1 Tax=Nitrospirillum amazonense TaxID=28077 RepID=A0A560GZT7_9PROT|nr:ABC transporter ATP-binding protein [Nitrospirillum amazonense]TWB39546.1 ATP-binding cassette subfamily C protein [Nitrospirillum amazonense]
MDQDRAGWDLLRSSRDFFVDFRAHARGDGLRVAALIVLGAGVEGVGLVLLVPLLGLVIGDARTGWAVTLAAHLPWSSADGGPLVRLLSMLACFAALVVLRAVVLWHRDVLLAKLRLGFVEELRGRLVARLIAAPWTRLATLSQARVNHLLGSDIILTGACVHFMLQGAASLFVLMMQWGLACLFSPALAALTGVLLVGAGVALMPQLIRSRRLARDVADANLHLATSGAQFLGGLKLALSQNLQHRFATEFNDTLHRLLNQQVALVKEQSKSQLAFTTLASLAGAAAIVMGVWALSVPPAVLIVFVLLLARMSAPAAQLQQGAQQFANFLPSYEKVRALGVELAQDAVVAADGADAPHFSARPQPIRFHQVGYRHPGSGRGVSGLDLTLEAGSFVGIVGASGAGKTTFADLIVGLTVPDTGTVIVGGQRLEGALRRRWAAAIAYAPQETFLFHDSIRANLSWAHPTATEADMRSALALAGATALVDRLPQGLDTVVGAEGGLLSGGERQRLALARALMRRPPLLVLDESTSAIDISGERTVLASLASLPWRPTIVLIAHRRESLALCDRVLEFANGRVVADDPHPSARAIEAGQAQS